MQAQPQRNILQRYIGILCITLGIVAIVGLVLFYSTSLFSDRFSILDEYYEMFRLLFSVPSGIIVICTLFFSIFFPLVFLVLFGLWLSSGKRYASNGQMITLLGLWIIAVLAGTAATVQQVGLVIDRIVPFSSDPLRFQIDKGIPNSVRDVFATTLKDAVNAKQGVPKDGYEPYMFLEVFPGLTESDFEGVQSSIGSYTMQDGRLVHRIDTTKLIHPAAKAVTDEGMETLLANVSVRLGIDLSRGGTITEVMNALLRSDNASSSKSL